MSYELGSELVVAVCLFIVCIVGDMCTVIPAEL